MFNKKLVTTLIQILIATGILVFMYLNIDINKIRTLIQNTIPFYLFLAFLALAVQLVIAAYRWLFLINLSGFYPSKWQCVGSCSAGFFLNTTLPGGFGGDIMRAWVTTKNGIPSDVSAYTVISDRILALAGYSLLVLSLLPYLLLTHKEMYSLCMITLSFGTILLLGFITLIIIAPTFKRLKINMPSYGLPIIKLSSMLCMTFKNKNYLSRFIKTNIIVHLTQIAAVILVAYALRVHFSPQAALIGVPIALLISALPITPGGWGIRESAMVFVLGQFQVGAEEALSISILFGICTTLSGLPAAIWWYLHRLQSKKYHPTSLQVDVSE
ncbi:MAG: lysylphosphatidylglycerol synthase transmembrane domain-containing protein [Legionellaceae bacterium]|nr:lysylphosphatidylglycerol synthase transmembrane domain-containing protein [Legionellaceae bacterium]